jgi:hypothetical protein
MVATFYAWVSQIDKKKPASVAPIKSTPSYTHSSRVFLEAMQLH